VGIEVVYIGFPHVPGNTLVLAFPEYDRNYRTYWAKKKK
jgi:hypothetical protein